MSVTYPADATATTYLFTLRGKVNTPTVADARELHNKTAGSADGIAAARALGDLSHNVYTSAGNAAGSDEVLIIDYWNSPSGFGQFFADPHVQAGAELLFTEREGILWAPTSGFGDFHLALPSGASPAAVGLLRAGVASLEAAAAAFNAYASATINTARKYGQIAHTTWSRLPDPGETISPEVIGVDLWIDADQMNAYYELGLGFEHFGSVFAGEPRPARRSATPASSSTLISAAARRRRTWPWSQTDQRTSRSLRRPRSRGCRPMARCASWPSSPSPPAARHAPSSARCCGCQRSPSASSATTPDGCTSPCALVARTCRESGASARTGQPAASRPCPQAASPTAWPSISRTTSSTSPTPCSASSGGYPSPTAA